MGVISNLLLIEMVYLILWLTSRLHAVLIVYMAVIRT